MDYSISLTNIVNFELKHGQTPPLRKSLNERNLLLDRW